MNHVLRDEGTAWCGEKLDNSFHFKTINQVMLNNLHGDRLPCQYCTRAIVRTLMLVPPHIKLTPEAQEAIIGGYGGI